MINTVKRPVLRWHGGKWMLAPWIISNFPSHRIYTEVYGGGASVLFRKEPSFSEVYNDMDGDAVNLFRVLRDPRTGYRLKELLELTPFSRDEFAVSYEPTAEPLEKARRLIVRSFMGFGSNACNDNRGIGFRACSNRSGTIPAHDWNNYPKFLGFAIQRLKGVVIENRPALELFSQHDSSKTLHYVDPPYVHATRKKGKIGNYNHEMTNEQHADLIEVLKGLEGMVILSGYPSDLYADLLRRWKFVDRNSLADGASPRIERLWFNNHAWDQRPQGNLI